MTELRDLWTALHALAAAQAELRTDLVAAHAALLRRQRDRARLARGSDPRDEDALARADEVIQRAEENIEELRSKLADYRREIAEAVAALEMVTDPRKSIGELDDGVPLLLMPVRIETRFAERELWVRIYPDQWAADGFQPALSETEIANATRFWAGMFRAGGEDGRRRAAWRGLVAGHGSGRAGWIVDRFRPLNPGAEPVRGSEDEEILVVAADLPLTPGEQATATTYWEAVWRAGDADGAAVAALREAAGDAVADAVLAHPPATLADSREGVDRRAVPVTVAFCQLPAVAEGDTTATAWTTAARVHVLPERFLLLGFQDGQQIFDVLGAPIPPELAVGPDPNAGPSDQFRIEDGDLVVPDELRWMTDFGEAVRVGMGMKVPLEPAQLHGFDRLLAIGLRAAPTPDEDRAELETLLTHHRRSRLGISILAQGTPTNNTEGLPSGMDRLDDPDASYDMYLGGASLPDLPEWDAKWDGQWLAEFLGIDPVVFEGVPGADGTDQAEARAANTALWPATLGYFLETMMQPLFEDATIEQVRRFFLDYVSGRGKLPVLRIGRQPYGIVPITALGRLDAGAAAPGAAPAPDHPVLAALNAMLNRATEDLAKVVDAVPHVFGGGEPHQTLLDVLGLHPASVEFHHRYAESLEDVFNRFQLDNLGPQFFAAWQTFGSLVAGRNLLAGLGYAGNDTPDVLSKLFHGAQHRLKGPVIDDRPLSETDPVRAYCDDGRNYLRWLQDAGSSSLEDLRLERGFTDDKVPSTLLYLLLRHALLLSWWDAGVRVRLEAGLLDETAFRLAHREPAFVHIAGDGPTESRWNALYDGAPAVTGDDRTVLHEFLPKLFGKPSTRHLGEVLAAIKALTSLPTARLERLTAEHLDTCSHRLDAWRLGLVTRRLLDLRELPAPDRWPGGAAPKPVRGIQLGAFGWLEDVHPEQHELTPVDLPAELAKVFARKQDPPLAADRSNGGFVHAPSLNHAATAAILRSGFLANATPAHPDTMALNISSERMRLAVAVLQGLRNGQSLGALLGYRFERGLHDRHALAEVDSVIHPLRLKFPADGDRDGQLTLDGLALARRALQPENRDYPFGLPDLPGLEPAQAKAVELEVTRLLDVHDALADLVLAEGVHQAVLGNSDRVAATLDAVGRGGFPTEPDVLRTPRDGITLTHRFAVHLRTGLDHTASPVAGVPMTPRATAEPAVNELLAALLPAAADVVVRVTWHDPDGAARERTVSQDQLGLQPIDLLDLLALEDQAALGELDERIVWQVVRDEGLRPDQPVEVHLTERVPGAVTFFEVAPLVAHLRALVTRARPVRPSDMIRAGDTDSAADAAVHADRARPAAIAAALAAEEATLTTLAADLAAVDGDPALFGQIDDLAARTVDAFLGVGRFGLVASGWGDLGERQATAFAAVLAAAAAAADRWQLRLDRAADLLAQDDALPNTATDAERIRVLLLADRELSGAMASPVPTDADAYRTAIETQRGAFSDRVAHARGVASAGSLSEALAALLPLDAFDPNGIDLAAEHARVTEFARHLATRTGALLIAVRARLAAAQARLADHDAAGPGAQRVEALTAAVTTLLGADALFVPEFDLSVAQGAEWSAAMAWSRSGGLTASLAARDFPVDDWLHGVARVREKVHAWEQAAVLASALGAPEPELWAVQLPHAAEPWLALEYPETFTPTAERLLWTAHYQAAFDPSASQAALLVDEWVELLPGEKTTTGVVFNYDAPDAEAPQAMLLVTPPSPVAAWRWEDVVDALHDALRLAKVRAIEPEVLAATPYAAFLPATVSEATVTGLGISMNLALNNDLFEYLKVRHG
jgi:hypothetical protein